MKQGWALLPKDLAIKPEARIGDKGVAYRGCQQRCFAVMMESGRIAIDMSYDVDEFLDSCVIKYSEHLKSKLQLRHYSTPVLPDDHSESVVGAPGEGPSWSVPGVIIPPRRHLS